MLWASEPKKGSRRVNSNLLKTFTVTKDPETQEKTGLAGELSTILRSLRRAETGQVEETGLAKMSTKSFLAVFVFLRWRMIWSLEAQKMSDQRKESTG